VLFALFVAAPSVRGEHEDWASVLEAFEDAWEIDGERNPGLRTRLRPSKRDALHAIGTSADGRAVGVVMAALKKQRRFIERLLAQWEERKAHWDEVAPAMERSLAEKSRRARGGNIMVTPAEQAWLREQEALEALYREITLEEQVVDIGHRAIARVLDDVHGLDPENREFENAFRHVTKALRAAKPPANVPLIHMLGRVRGPEVTELLRAHARDLRSETAQAALEALGRQNADESIAVLLERLEDPRWQIRAAALRGLSFYREARVVDALLEHVEKEDGVLRRHVFTALGRILGESLPGTVEAWSSWWRAHREELIAKWDALPGLGPVQDDLPPVHIEGHRGSTSFYGIQTTSKHIIFVIDVSGSMGEFGGTDEQGRERIDVVKSELTNAIRSLTAEDGDDRGTASFNIVAYAADVRVYKDGKMIPATRRNKDKAFAWIDDLEAIGATNIFDALEQAFQIIGGRASRDLERGADTIFLMTDGKPNRGRVTDPVLIRSEIRKLNLSRQITIHTIGVGPDHNAAFLRALASENNGQYLAR
jgi:uncharacterized protein YegL